MAVCVGMCERGRLLASGWARSVALVWRVWDANWNVEMSNGWLARSLEFGYIRELEGFLRPSQFIQ